MDPQDYFTLSSPAASNAEARSRRRRRALAWLLAVAGVVSIALLLVALLAAGRSSRAFGDVNQSGSLRYRSMWVYGATLPSAARLPEDPAWPAQIAAMQAIRRHLHFSYPRAVDATDPAWAAFSGSLARTGHVDWKTANAMRTAADTLTAQIAEEAAAQTAASALGLRLGLLGLLCALAASGCLLSGLRQAEGDMAQALADQEESRDLFLRSINALQEGYLVQDRDGRTLLCNRSAERLLGVSAAGLVGRAAFSADWNFFGEDGRFSPEAQHLGMRALHSGLPQEKVVLGVERPGASRLWFSVQAAPVFHAGDDQAYAAVLTFTDITAEKQIQEDLQKEREFQSAMLESLQSGVVACDAGGVLALFNRAAREFHGMPEEALPAEEWADHFDLYQPDGITPLPTDEIPLFRAYSGETVRDAEMVIAPKDGPHRIVQASGQAIYSRSGQKIGAVAAMHDITARRRAELELSRLAAIVESSEEAILAASLDGTLVSWNTSAERLYGRKAAEIIGCHASVLITEGEVSHLKEVAPRLLRGESVAPVEVLYRRPDDSVVNLALSFSPIHDGEGVMAGISCISRDITARRQVENALRESESRLRYLSDAAFEGIAVSQNGTVLDANPAFLSLYGYTREQVIGKPSLEFIVPQSRALAQQKIAAGDEKAYEVECLRGDGSTFHAEVRGRQVLWNGQPARVTAVLDISERKLMEDALRAGHAAMKESEARLAEAQRIAKVGSWEYDPATGAVVWSGEMFRLLGRDPGLGVPQFEEAMALYHPEDAPELKRLVRRAAVEGLGYELDLRGRSCFLQDGSLRWYHTTGEVMRDAAGGVVRLTGTLADITERKVLEEALQESQQFTQSIADNSASIIYVYDLMAHKNVYANRNVSELLGYTSEQLSALGANFLQAVLHPDDLPRMAAHHQRFRTLEDGAVIELEYRIKDAAGQYRWLWKREVVFKRHPDGTVWQVLSNAQDITERKALEEALRCSEEAMRAVLCTAPMILYTADINGTITLSEGTGLQALGLTPGEAVGRSVDEFSGGDPCVLESHRRALAGEAVSYDARFGSLWLHVALQPQRDAHGTVIGFIGVSFDITERAQSEERFRVLFEQSSDAHLLFDETGIIDCNPAAVAMLNGTDKSDVLALHPAVLSPEFQPDGQRSDVKCIAMDTAAYESGYHRFEWTHRKMNGEEFPVEVTLTPVTLQGKPVLLAVWHDLTEQKLAEQQIKDYMVILEFQNSQLEETNKELESLATTDGLTGLKNRRTFGEKLAEEYARAVRYHQPLSLLLLDVDHFKQYNDAFGHPAGDAVLRSVASALGRTARDTDVAARYGGEEFAVILPFTDEAGALTIAERVRAAIAGAEWEKRSVTVSVGVGTLSLDTPTPDSLVSCADGALYQSKEAGRNRVTHGNPSAPPIARPPRASRAKRLAAS